MTAYTQTSQKLNSDLEEAIQLVARRMGEQKILQEQVIGLNKESKEAKAESQQLGDSIKLVQVFSGGIRTGVIDKFEELMTNAVREIYGRDYSITIEFEAKGGSFWADFFIILPSGKKVNLAKEGGGLRDIVSVLARILYLMMDPSRPAKILVFDENLSNLDEWRSPDGIRLIFKVIKELGIQSIFITHKEAISSGKVELPDARMYRFRLTEDDKTACEELTS